ncbi:DUF6220 domain-containing protein [Neobacillus thermocopriae]|uniref:DUF6220 domain-containing protein n=1 Tax=Neobacillus thermocopriae TaxID=1215031 RepID=UPI002E203CFB|nr:DUF6220 domain-containing protein [Neobacillus thermocopriae]MED3714753.1 DUF6220 domain-containing protein [Neobacillus thermocopriae]
MEKNLDSKRIHIAQKIYVIFSLLYACCLIVQVFFAGLAIFVNPANWEKHLFFVHLFGMYIPLFMLILSFVGKMPRWAIGESAGFIGLIFAMYFTANITQVNAYAAAAHPVVAIVLISVSFMNVAKGWRFVFTGDRKSIPQEK